MDWQMVMVQLVRNILVSSVELHLLS
jgi:hypothetical protein